MCIRDRQKPAIRIDVDPAKLANMGMTLEDVRGTLTNATVNAPKGSLDGPARSLTVQANDQITEPGPYGNLIIAYRNGAPVRVRDIGTATRGPQNNEQLSWQLSLIHISSTRPFFMPLALSCEGPIRQALRWFTSCPIRDLSQPFGPPPGRAAPGGQRHCNWHSICQNMETASMRHNVVRAAVLAIGSLLLLGEMCIRDRS